MCHELLALLERTEHRNDAGEWQTAAGVLSAARITWPCKTKVHVCPVFRTSIDLDSQKALMQIHLAVPTAESCENCHNSTEIIFPSCFDGLVPCWSTQRSWLLSPLENKAIKKPQSRNSREKPLSRFLLSCIWTGCIWRLLPRKRALGWPCAVGSDIPVPARSWWGCCGSFGIDQSFSVCPDVCGESCTQRWTVGSGWAEIYCWEWDTCLHITLGVFEQPFLVQKAQI